VPAPGELGAGRVLSREVVRDDDSGAPRRPGVYESGPVSSTDSVVLNARLQARIVSLTAVGPALDYCRMPTNAWRYE
jgi:hypothetical protein